MAEQFNFKELDKHLRAEWLAKRPDFVQAFIDNIQNIADTHMTEALAVDRWAEYIDIERQAPHIYYYLASCQDSMPIQNMIGGMATLINDHNERDLPTVWNTHQIASEIIFALNGIFTTVQLTYNGKYVVRSLLRDPELSETLMYPLPLAEPAYASRALGAYAWNITNDDALNVLNAIPMTIMQFPEQMPFIGANPSDADKELMVKYEVRKALQPSFSGKRIFYNWHSDYRGRMSPGAYHFNPHGNEYEKSIIAFAEPEKVSWAGVMEYRKALARCAGLGKDTDMEKLKWYAQNSLTNFADVIWKEPHTAVSILTAFEQIKNTGRTNIPIELDSTNSQLQMVAVLTGDMQTALTCNVVPDGDKIADAYGILAEIMTKISGKLYTRHDVKYAMMVAGYGGGKDVVIAEFVSAMDNDYDVGETYETFLAAMEYVSPASGLLKDTFDNLWKDDWTEVTWTLPDGFVACYKPVQTMTLTLRPFGIDIECLATVNQAIDFSTALYVNVIHSVDAYVARQKVIRAKGKSWSIHDGFPMRANFVSTGVQNYKDILGEIADSRLLEDILTEISGSYVPTFGKQFGNDAIQLGNYAIS